MSEFEPLRSGLPVPLTEATPRPSLARSAPTAAFVSQLIASRDHMPTQRPRRTNSVDNALGAYNRGATIAVRRLPQGYRKSVNV